MGGSTDGTWGAVLMEHGGSTNGTRGAVLMEHGGSTNGTWGQYEWKMGAVLMEHGGSTNGTWGAVLMEHGGGSTNGAWALDITPGWVVSINVILCPTTYCHTPSSQWPHPFDTFLLKEELSFLGSAPPTSTLCTLVTSLLLRGGRGAGA